MAVEKFVNITEKEIKELGVQALADRPNRKSPYGSGGLSASQLKAWFDNLTILLADKINTLQDTFADPEEASKYIVIQDWNYSSVPKSLYDLYQAMKGGTFAEEIMQIFVKKGDTLFPDGFVPRSFYPLKAYLDAMIIEYRRLNTDTNDSLGNLVDNDTYTAKVAELEAGLSGKVDNASYVNDNAAVQKALAQKVNTTDFEKVKQELNTTDIRLTNIEARFSDDAVIDSTVAYEKAVPANALPYAEVQKVGGMTYKISPPFSTLVDNGTGTINTDGSITVTNTSEEDVYYNDNGIDTENVGGKYFALSSECPYIKYIAVRLIYVKQNQETGGFDVNEVSYPLNTWIPEFNRSEYESVDGRLDFTIAANAGTVTFTPILTDTDDLVPKLLDTKVTELVSEGANLMPPCIRKNVTNNGITYTVLDDGTVIANGTATAQSNFAFQEMWRGEKITLTQGETYTLSGEPNGASADTYRLMMQNASYSQNYYCGVPAVAKYTEYYAFIRIQQGITVNNLVFKPMLNRGSTAKPYSPYGTIVDTFPISAELRAFLEPYGYGRGVSGYPNYIDFERKVFVQNTYRKVFDGTENWIVTSAVAQGTPDVGIKRMLFQNTENKGVEVSNKIVSPMVCNLYKEDTLENTYYQVNKTCAFSGYRIYIYDADYNTADSVEAWKAHLAELYASGNPLIIEYALAEPIETDISAYLTDDNFIEVEGGGVIRAVNDYEYGAPSTIEYQTEAVE
jgi:hypothetical protein